jgi:GNAT superfamily N-acetyltransferase
MTNARRAFGSAQARELLVRLCAALWGFAIAIALLPLWERPAPPAQPPGYMTALGIDAHASLRFTLGLIVVPMLVVLLMRRACALLARDDTRAWARNTFCGATALAIWYVINERSLFVIVALPLAALIAAIALRRFRARFSRGDMILIPTTMAVYIALLDVMPKAVHVVMTTAIVLVFVVRLAARTYLAFTLSPLALALQTHFLSYHQRHLAWPQLAVALGAPHLLRFVIRDSATTRRRLRATIAFVVYPLAAYAYLSAISLLAAEGLPHADLFEDSHNLLAASQMLHGEKPYRDIIPSHGLIHDGLLPYAALRTGPVELGRAIKVRGVIGALNVVCNYALAAAATGSPEVGIATVFLGAMFGTGGGTARVLPALVTLVLIAAALRRRDPRWLAPAGVIVVIAILNSLDFGLFALVIILIAVLRFRGQRLRALAYTAMGGAGAAIVTFVILGVYGIAGDFVRVTLFEIAPLSAVYSLNPWTTPPTLAPIHNAPEVLAAIFDKSSYLFVLWALVAIAVAAALLRRDEHARRRARDEAILIIALFVLICGFSYAERHHLYWQFVAAPLMSTAIFRLSRGSWRALTPAAVLAAIMIGQPTQHIAIVGALRLAHGNSDPHWRELGLPRAQGALINDRDAAVIDAVVRYARPRLAEGETFFDFSNRNLFYFLLDRDCPIRQPEVAFYETEALQREVIARLDHNPRIRFAIVSANVDAASVDGIPNSTRAPLVWAYIQQHFSMDHEEAGLQFWYRK